MQISRLIEMIHILLDKRAVTAAELAETFTWDAVRAHPDGLAVPGGFFG